jgi:hypothetical protein
MEEANCRLQTSAFGLDAEEIPFLAIALGALISAEAQTDYFKEIEK